MARKFKLNLNKMKQKAEKDLGNGQDPRFWQITNRSENKSYGMRMLPSNDGTDGENCYHSIQSHSFDYIDKEGKKKKYYIVCPTTFGDKCPICEYVYDLWQTKDPEDEKLARVYGKKKAYLTNVLITEDETNTDNVGKVFMTKLGKQAFGKVLEKISPSKIMLNKRGYTDYNPYDIYEAGDFLLEFVPENKKTGEYPHYNNSAFLNDKEYIEPIGGTDEKAEDAMEKAYNLQEYLDEIKTKHCPEYNAIIEAVGHVLDGEGDYNESTGEDEEYEIEKETTPKRNTPKPEVVEEDDDFDEMENVDKEDEAPVEEEEIKECSEEVTDNKTEDVIDEDDDFSDFE